MTTFRSFVLSCVFLLQFSSRIIQITRLKWILCVFYFIIITIFLHVARTTRQVAMGKWNTFLVPLSPLPSHKRFSRQNHLLAFDWLSCHSCQLTWMVHARRQLWILLFEICRDFYCFLRPARQFGVKNVLLLLFSVSSIISFKSLKRLRSRNGEFVSLHENVYIRQKGRPRTVYSSCLRLQLFDLT